MIFTVNIHNTTELPCRLYSEHSCHEYVSRIPIMAKKTERINLFISCYNTFQKLESEAFYDKAKMQF